jgi:hypothetical protein
MLFPTAPKNMYEHRSSSVKNFGYDKTTNSIYNFNSLGYRSNTEFTPVDNAILFLGNSITFGIGLNHEETFCGIVAGRCNDPVYNFSWGCYAHTNSEYLCFLKSLLKTIQPKFICYQINNLDCYRENGKIVLDKPIDLLEDEFKKFYLELQDVLKKIQHTFLYWDNREYNIDISNCLINQQYQVDHSLPDNKETFGKKSHLLIGLKILEQLKANA